jgi:hypothetical protein
MNRTVCLNPLCFSTLWLLLLAAWRKIKVLMALTPRKLMRPEKPKRT